MALHYWTRGRNIVDGVIEESIEGKTTTTYCLQNEIYEYIIIGMKTPSFFKLSTEAAQHLEAALAFFSRSGHKTNKTELVQQSIFTLPINEDQLKDRPRAERSKPVPPLLAELRAWRAGEQLTRSQFLHLAEEGYEAIRRHHPGFYNHELIADTQRAFKAVRGLRPTKARTPELDGLDEYYLGNLVEKRDGGLLPSVDATITRILDPNFAGSPDYPSRNLHVALRDEPPLDTAALNNALAPYLPTIFRLALRHHWIETGQLFLDPNSEPPPTSEYWGEIYKSGSTNQGPYELSWNCDHTTLGGFLSLETDKGQVTVELQSFPTFWDFFYLTENVAHGGSGGTRGDFTFERNQEPFSAQDGTKLIIGHGMARVSITLNRNLTTELLNLVEMVFSDPVLTETRNSLCWIYGDI